MDHSAKIPISTWHQLGPLALLSPWKSLSGPLRSSWEASAPCLTNLPDCRQIPDRTTCNQLGSGTVIGLDPELQPVFHDSVWLQKEDSCTHQRSARANKTCWNQHGPAHGQLGHLRICGSLSGLWATYPQIISTSRHNSWNATGLDSISGILIHPAFVSGTFSSHDARRRLDREYLH